MNFNQHNISYPPIKKFFVKNELDLPCKQVSLIGSFFVCLFSDKIKSM